MKRALAKRHPPSTHVSLSLIVAIGAHVLGCGREVAPHAYDKESLEALMKYAPEYKLDANGRVTEMKLENKQLDDDAFDRLANLTALRALSLWGSSVTDANLAKLQAVGQLEALGLGSTQVTDAGLAHLAALPSLRWLWLNGEQRATSDGIQRLKASLPNLVVYK